MTDAAKATIRASGYRITEVEGRPNTKQRWPLYELDLGDDMPHPNKHKPWAFPTDDTQPPPPPMTTRPPPTPVRLDVADEAGCGRGDANETNVAGSRRTLVN